MKRRLPQLDALRTLAIVLVLGRHADRLPPVNQPVLFSIFLVWRRCGWIGVDLFFVLSGYLISGLLFREYRRLRSVNIKQFLIRRAMKIYPPFYALLAFTGLFAIHSHLFGLRPFLAEAFFVQNYFPGFWPHTWSLAVEEQFYLACALGVYLLIGTESKNPFRLLPFMFLLTAIACLTLRWRALSHSHRLEYDSQIFPMHLNADSLLFGVLLCYMDEFHQAMFRQVIRRHRVLIAIASIALIAPAFFFNLEGFFMPTMGFTFLYLGFGGVLMLAVVSERAERSRTLRWIGRIGFFSYSIYLWHIPWRHLFPLAHVSDSQFWPRWVLYFIGSIAVGMIMSWFIELPALYLRDRILPSIASDLPKASQPR